MFGLFGSGEDYSKHLTGIGQNDVWKYVSIDLHKLVNSAYKYFLTQLELDENDEDDVRKVEDYIEQHWEEYKMLERIITLEMSIYSLRRISGVYDNNLEALQDIKCEEIKRYEETFNKKYISLNDGIN